MGNPLAVYDSIKSACYHGNLSSTQYAKMKGDIAALDLSGKALMGIGVGGVVFTYIVWQVPYIGPLVGLVTGTASIAAGILGYDIHISANNLQEYANHRFSNFGKQVVGHFVSVVTGSNATEQQFARDFLITATKNTLVVGQLYAVMIGKRG